MINIQKKILRLLYATLITSSIINGNTKLSDLNYKSASVLPYYYHKKEKWVILPQEGYGKDKGTVDDLGGSRDKGEKHPIVTAAREFYEEGILQQTIGLSLPQIRDLLNKKSKNIIVYSDNKGSCNVTYIVNFNQYKEAFFNNFYPARKKATQFKYKEKDKIIVVKWQHLENAFIKQNSLFKRWSNWLFPQKNIITVPALEQDPQTYKFKHSTVTLRPFLVKKLRPFFLNKPYKQGFNKRARFYNG